MSGYDNKWSTSENEEANKISSSKNDEVIFSLKAEISQYKSKLNAIIPEITKYQKIIDSLKAEISEYKSKLDMLAFASQQKGSDSVREEISEYKEKLNKIIPEITHGVIDSLKAEITEYKNRDAQYTSSNYAASDQQILNSLNNEIAKLKKNLELLSLE